MPNPEPTSPGIAQSQPDIQEPSSSKQKPAAPHEKHPSKAALNYLFQKLGNSYPKRHLLKQPTFPDYSNQQSHYYSDLFKGDCLQVPHKVHFNNQTYDILSGNLLPNEWSSTTSTTKYPPLVDDETFSHLSHANRIISGDTHNEPLSDSDISIPDSLEDFQQQHQPPKLEHNNNKYNKYDERIARGDVDCTKPRSRPQNYRKKGIAYFLPLGETAAPAKNGMPASLKKKLRSRSKNLSRHTLCVEVKKKSPKRSKLCHKQIQTSLNGDLAKLGDPANLTQRRKGVSRGEDQLPQGDESDLDEKIMDILLKGLKMQEIPEASSLSGENAATRSVSKDADSASSPKGQPVVSEYVEMYRVTTPATHEIKEPHFHAENLSASNDMFEVLQSEEEIGQINSTNYYKSVKKSRRIYYPTKATAKPSEKSSSSNGCSTQPNQTVPAFSRYQKKLREFRHQIRRQNFEKINPLSSGSGSSNDTTTNCAEGAAPQQVRIKKMLRDKHKMKNYNCKIPGIRFNRFHQRFEAIPEEMGASSTEQVEPNHDPKTGPMETAVNSMKVDENKNVQGANEQRDDILNDDKGASHQQADSQGNEVKEVSSLENATTEQTGDQQTEYTDELKSQKGKNSLSVVREQEELITLSRGWINFYLLNGNHVDDNDTTDQIEGNSIPNYLITSNIIFFCKKIRIHYEYITELRC